jgi:hypothetical protein
MDEGDAAGHSLPAPGCLGVKPWLATMYTMIGSLAQSRQVMWEGAECRPCQRLKG